MLRQASYTIEQRGSDRNAICAVFSKAGEAVSKSGFIDTGHGIMNYSHPENVYNLQSLQDRIRVGKAQGEDVSVYEKAETELQKAVDEFDAAAPG